MTYKRRVLPNGLRLITVPMPSLESVTAMVMVGAGSRYETKEISGISHFLEHMAFKGTEKRQTAQEISSLVDGIGGEFNAFTTKEITGYYIKAAASHLALTLDILSDMLMHSKFDPAEIEKEKGVIMEEMNLYEDNPARKIGDVYETLLYGNTPMGWDVLGHKEAVKNITREDFLKYLGTFYSASNMTLVVAGGVTQEEAQDLAEKYFGKMSKFDTQGYSKVEENQKSPAVLVKKKVTEQVHIALGFRTVAIDHPDRYPLSILSAILGGGMSSRLFVEVREKRGLAYYARTMPDHYQDAGTIVSLSGIDPKRAEEAISVILEEHRKLTTDNSQLTSNVSEEELQKAKEFLKGHLVLELEDSRSVAGFYAQQEVLEREIKNPDEIIKETDRVMLDDIQRVVETYFKPESLNLAIIGNFEDEERFLKLLK